MNGKASPERANRDELKTGLIKLALELSPLVLFFVLNSRTDIYVATAGFMAAMLASLLLSWLILKRVAVMPLVTGAMVLVFGGLTLWLHDDSFIKLKPTIVNVFFGSVLLGGLLFGRDILRYVFGDVYQLQPEGWRILTWRWTVYFFVLAAMNEVVWRNFSTDFWVAFKVWGIMPVTLVFSFVFVVPVVTKYALQNTDSA